MTIFCSSIKKARTMLQEEKTEGELMQRNESSGEKIDASDVDESEREQMEARVRTTREHAFECDSVSLASAWLVA